MNVGDTLIGNRPVIYFRGAMTPYVLQLLPLGLSCAAWAWWRRRTGAAVGAWSLAWFLCTFLPFCAASLFGQRVVYLYYVLPSLPAIALSGSYFLTNVGLPRFAIWIYVLAVLASFYGYFPFWRAP